MDFAYKDKHLHFVGVGGVSMSRLLRICHARGALVSGSDRADSPTLRALSDEGYDVYCGHDPAKAAQADLVIYTSAVREDDPERQAAARSMERSELLAHIASLYPVVVAVAGTHGKTTVCGMIAAILRAAGVQFCAHIGGTMRQDEPDMAADGVFLTEACEYRRHFLRLRPTVGVVCNVEHDHPDCYPDLEAVYEAFEAFGAQCRSVITKDRRILCKLAHTSTCTYDDMSISTQNIEQNTYLLRCNQKEMTVRLKVWGEFNMQNAAFAAETASILGVEPEYIKEGLETFEGAKRRQELVGYYKGMPVLSDYAHHPTEIYALTKEASKRYRNVAVVFEPHTYSRTKALLARFGTCFCCERLYLLPTYAAREQREDAVDEALLSCVEVKQKSLADWRDTLCQIQKLPHKNYGAILFVGAGNVDAFAKELVALEQKKQ